MYDVHCIPNADPAGLCLEFRDMISSELLNHKVLENNVVVATFELSSTSHTASSLILLDCDNRYICLESLRVRRLSVKTSLVGLRTFRTPAHPLTLHKDSDNDFPSCHQSLRPFKNTIKPSLNTLAISSSDQLYFSSSPPLSLPLRQFSLARNTRSAERKAVNTTVLL